MAFVVFVVVVVVAVVVFVLVVGAVCAGGWAGSFLRAVQCTHFTQSLLMDQPWLR